MSEYRRVVFKPGDPDTYMMLTSDGRIEVRGSVPNPDVDLGWDKSTYKDVGRDLCVTDWTGPGGYVLSGWGTVHTFGTAVAPPVYPAPGSPQSIQGQDLYRALVMDPAGNGRGYRLRADGVIDRIGATLPPALSSTPTLGFFNGGKAWYMTMDWATKKYYVLGSHGYLQPLGGAPALVNYSPTWILPGSSYCRAVAIGDWTTGDGYTMDNSGVIRRFGPSPKTQRVTPNWAKQGWNIARDFRIISYNPFIYKIFTSAGAVHTVIASDPPVVDAIFPTDPTTNLAQPGLTWSWTDVNGDPPELFDLAVYTSAQYGIGGFTPFVSPATFQTQVSGGRDEITSLDMPFEIANGTYRFYVRAKEFGSGLYSNTAYKQWVQNYTPSAGPNVTYAQQAPLGHKFTLSWSTGVAPDSWLTTGVEAQVETPEGWKSIIRVPFIPVNPVRTNPVNVYDYETPQSYNYNYRFRFYNSNPVVDAQYTAWTYYSIVGNVYQTQKTWVSRPFVTGSAKVFRVESLEMERPVATGEFDPIGEEYKIGISDANSVKGEEGNLVISTLNPLEREDFENMFLNHDDVLLLRDQFGRMLYFRIRGSVQREQLKASPLPIETTSVRSANRWTMGIFQVGRP